MGGPRKFRKLLNNFFGCVFGHSTGVPQNSGIGVMSPSGVICLFKIVMQYGLWDRYSELYPSEDLVYTIGKSDYGKDRFFAHVNRKQEDNIYQGTTWQIKFILDSVVENEMYKLRVALASASLAELQVRVNNPNTNCPLFSSCLIGRDNAIARHGIHGLYWLYNVDIKGALLVEGENTIFLTNQGVQVPFRGLCMITLGLKLHPPTIDLAI